MSKDKECLDDTCLILSDEHSHSGVSGVEIIWITPEASYKLDEGFEVWQLDDAEIIQRVYVSDLLNHAVRTGEVRLPKQEAKQNDPEAFATEYLELVFKGSRE